MNNAPLTIIIGLIQIKKGGYKIRFCRYHSLDEANKDGKSGQNDW